MAIFVSSPSLFHQFFDNNGKPLSGGKIYTFRASTSIPKNTYQDSAGVALNTNPIQLDEAGRARIFIESNTAENDPQSSAYRFVLYDRNNILVDSIDNIYPINGVDGKNTGTIVVGPTGGPGLPGKSIKGDTGPVGKIGPIGRNGKIQVMYRTAGTYTFVVPDGVTEIFYTLGGGGGGFYIETTLPNIGNVGSGLAGKIIAGTILVAPGDVITIVVGAGGQATTDQAGANGKTSTMQAERFGTIQAVGGTAGNTVNLSASTNYFQKISPFFQEQTFSGFIPTIVPQPVYGETCQFGQGGGIFRGSADATGNCASGGSGVPVLSNNTLQISSFGKGGDGICILEYLIDNEDEE